MMCVVRLPTATVKFFKKKEKKGVDNEEEVWYYNLALAKRRVPMRAWKWLR